MTAVVRHRSGGPGARQEDTAQAATVTPRVVAHCSRLAHAGLARLTAVVRDGRFLALRRSHYAITRRRYPGLGAVRVSNMVLAPCSGA